jgi:hypothetical protein
MRLYKALHPIKQGSQWLSIGSLLYLDDEEGKVLASGGVVLELSVPKAEPAAEPENNPATAEAKGGKNSRKK